MLSDDERRALGAIEAALESDIAYATQFLIRADELDRHDRRPRRWVRLAVVATLLCVTFLVVGLSSLAMVAAAVAAFALAARAVVALRTPHP